MAQNARHVEGGFHEAAVQHLDGLYAYAMTLARNQAEAEDLVQETYLRALRAWDRLRPNSNLKSWLFTILRNLRLNQIRDDGPKSRMVRIDDTEDGPRDIEDKAAQDPFSVYVTKLNQEDVRQAIANLPMVYREVITLREFEELSYEEIAGVLNCPTGTVMSRLSRAREKLKELLLQREPTPKIPAE